MGISHQQGSIGLKKEKSIGLPYIALMERFQLIHSDVENLEFCGKKNNNASVYASSFRPLLHKFYV